MAKFINGRWVSDAELYPEQYEELPDEALPKTRNRSVKLIDIDGDGDERRGKSPKNNTGVSKKGAKNSFGIDPTAVVTLGSVVNGLKVDGSVEDAVNPRETSSDDLSVEQIYSKKRKDTARAYAMKTVANLTVTERKLREKLKLREYSEEEIDEAIDYVKKFGYINDSRLAQGMLDKLAARQWGRFKICYYLKGKGIPEDIIEELDFSEIDFPYHCAALMRKYPPERRDAMLRAVKNAGYTSEDLRLARRILADEE